MNDTVSLKEYVDRRFDDSTSSVQAALTSAKEAVAAALAASEKAVDKAETAQSKVNATQNEFRGTLKDQAATLMPIKEAEAKFEAQQKQIAALQRLVYIGVGGALMLQIVLRFIK